MFPSQVYLRWTRMPADRCVVCCKVNPTAGPSGACLHNITAAFVKTSCVYRHYMQWYPQRCMRNTWRLKYSLYCGLNKSLLLLWRSRGVLFGTVSQLDGQVSWFQHTMCNETWSSVLIWISLMICSIQHRYLSVCLGRGNNILMFFSSVLGVRLG